MAKQTLNTIKNWFKTGLKPTQAQFWDTWDSFFHKDDPIPIKNIESLGQRFNEKADREAFENHLEDADAHGISSMAKAVDLEVLRLQLELMSTKLTLDAPIQVFDEFEYSIVWDDAKKAKYGDYGHFEIWMNGGAGYSLQSCPISFTTSDDGKPAVYTLTLDNIESLIFIRR